MSGRYVAIVFAAGAVLGCERSARVGGLEPPEPDEPWPGGIAPCDRRAAEICNGRDDDCDALIDEGAQPGGDSICADPCRVVQVQSSCALRADGDLYCWASGTGSGTERQAMTPVRVPIGPQVLQTSIGCARTTAGQAMCWGWTARPGLVDHTPGVVTALGNTVAEVMSEPDGLYTPRWLGRNGVGITGLRCARRSGHLQGTLWCWNRGDSLRTGRERPQPLVNLGDDVEQIALGAILCARKADGSVWCARDRRSWQELALVEPFGTDNVDVAVGTHVCVVKRAGHVVCLGPPFCPEGTGRTHDTCRSSNAQGELGTGDTEPARTPVVAAVALGNDVTKLVLEGGVSCALTRAGAVRCVGARLGPRTVVADPMPYVPPGLERDVVDLAAGCAVKTDGSLWCWGMLPGNGSSEFLTTPVAIDVCPERRR